MAVYLDHTGRPLPQKLADSDGIRFHYIRGGNGPTVVLVAGFPQSVYAWRRVIPLLTDAYDVIALDLPGQGDSDKPLDGYDTATAAKRINGLLKTLGVGRHYFVGHDIGSWIGYPYAHEFASELDGVVYLDANIPGVTLKPSIDVADPDYWKSWHFLFNMVDDLPEALLRDRERILIEWFFNKKTANAIATFSKEDIDEYVRVYSSLGGLRGMLGYYRAVIRDMDYNRGLFQKRIAVPVLALGGDAGSAPGIFEAMRPLAENIRGGVILDSGHYIPEEQPAALVAELRAFFEIISTS
ncbi:alpha/beta hydrolase [Tardiphaga sp. 709]|uniref:alpha/beta fold hydrolase n=1 Tax=Tardiphaga sp. 709 TaxID=3076039 RepID=UPI0028E459BE|nr:alpha/beta hydrolase [Tardiphaga sp. 709]WNV11589.1 alpha/beta hydrolase [Tardiphaga sp. 709]